MKQLLLLLLMVALISCQEPSHTENKDMSKSPSVERLSPDLDKYIPKDANIDVLAEGFTWSEGPVWVDKGEYVLFSDVPEDKIYKWKEGEGKSLYLTPSGYTGEAPHTGERGANGLILDEAGNLLMCQHGDRRVARMASPLDDPKAEYETLADRYDGKRFNSPNDLVMDSRGNIYFTDPPYGLEKGPEDPSRELDFCGVYMLDTSGSVHLLVDSLSRPNGIALSPDEKTLYVANSDPGKAFWAAYKLDSAGMVKEGGLWVDATSKLDENNQGLPDGLKIHRDGTLFATGPGGVWIISPKGEQLGLIRTGQATANCAWGKEGRSLFMTADMYLMRISVLP
jgi:gluconolactonase